MHIFNNFDEVIKNKFNRIITKRIEPYDVIESAKKFYNCTDYTFTGRDKFDILDKFLTDLATESKTQPALGLYMKNVNKFYLLTIKENPDNLSCTELLHKLLITDEYGFSKEEQISQTGIDYSDSIEYSIEQIDMGKAEATFIIL